MDRKRITATAMGLCGLIGGMALPTTATGQVLAFPGAEGFGAYATGARTDLASASVYHVTNLNADGPGSFRDAVSQPNRFVVFDVSGVVNVSPDDSTIVVQDNVTIAGQTSPGGIVIYGNRVSYSGANNTISRYFAIRKGNAGYRDDASGAANGVNMMFDHMSIMWGVDETFSLNWDGKGSGLNNITLQDSIIAQGQDRLGHSAGGLMTLPEGSGFSVIRSIFADNVTRNPKVRGENEYINNVVYGWENAAYIMGDTTGMDSHANAIGNYFIEGPVDGSDPFTRGTANFHIYGEDNYVDDNRNGLLDGVPVTSYPGADVVASPFAFPTTTAMSAQDALAYVVEHAGPSIIRDVVDTRVADEIMSYGTLGGVIQRETDLFPNYGSDPQYVNVRARMTDADNDGIADDWESAHGLSGSDPNDWKNLSAAGYTQLEEYVNELGADGAALNSSGGDWSTAWGTAPTLADDVTLTGALSMNITSGNAFARRLTQSGDLNMTAGTLDVFDTASVAGTLSISNATASFGQLLLGVADQGGAVILSAGGTLQTGTIARNGRGGSILFNGGTIRATGTPNIDANALIAAAGGTFDTSGYSGAFSGQISGPGLLTKLGGGTLTLSADNTYTGGTNVTGLIKLTHDTAAGAGTITINASGGTVLLGDGITVNNDLVTNYIYEILDVPDDNASATFAGNIATSGNKQVRLRTTGENATLNLTGAVNAASQYFIIKTGHIVVKDNGAITSGPAIIGRDGAATSMTIQDNAGFTATSLSIGGGKTLSSCALTVEDNASLSIGASVLDLLSTSSSTSTSELNLNGGTTTVGGLIKGSTGAGQSSQINFNGGTLRYGGGSPNGNFLPVLTGLTTNVQAGGVIIDDNGQAITIAQPLLHDAALATPDGGLTKLGDGTLTLTGANTYNGPTTIAAGELVMNNTNTATGVTVENGATFGGNALVDSVTANSGSVVAPGNSIGTLDILSGMTLDGTLAIELDGAGAGSSDVINVSGPLDLTGASVDFSLVAGGLPLDDYAYVFVNYVSLTGTFGTNITGLPAGYQIDYAYENRLGNNHIALVKAPAIPGDLNGDGYVGLDDLQPILDHWNQNVTTGDASMGDVSGPDGVPDGYVGLDDLQPVLEHWNEGTPPVPSNIPEPTTYLMLLTGTAATITRRRVAQQGKQTACVSDISSRK